MSLEKKLIVIVEDDPGVSKLVARLARASAGSDYDILVYDNIGEAQELARTRLEDLAAVITDQDVFKTPTDRTGGLGTDLATYLRNDLKYQGPIIGIPGQPLPQHAEDLFDEVFIKAFNPSEFKEGLKLHLAPEKSMILYVEDDQGIAEAVMDVFAVLAPDHKLVHFDSLVQAKEFARKYSTKIGLLLTDQDIREQPSFGNALGSTLAAYVRNELQRYSGAVVSYSARDLPADKAALFDKVCKKPIDGNELRALVTTYLPRR